VFKALRGGVHPIAVREFRFRLSEAEEQQLKRLMSKLARCPPHVVKLLGSARIPGPGGGHFIAAPLFDGGSLKNALAGPKAGDLLWYRKCV